MLILTLRTDKPEAEIGLYKDKQQLFYHTWQAHRQLAETIHKTIAEQLAAQAKDWHDIQGIVVYKGPGSFTGLRIGLTVANTLADSLAIPIISEMGEDWLEQGLKRLLKGENEGLATPEYGAPPRVTKPRK